MLTLNSGMSHSYSTQRDKNLSKHAVCVGNSRRFDDRSTDSAATLANQVCICPLVYGLLLYCFAGAIL